MIRNKREDKMKEKKKESKEITNHNFIDAWKNAFNGIIYATTTQKNIQKQDCSKMQQY